MIILRKARVQNDKKIKEIQVLKDSKGNGQCQIVKKWTFKVKK
jgi:hypothetical protein